MKHLVLSGLLIAAICALPAQAEISYTDILADPDNPSLNQQFARERLAAGDAKAALAAVERVLVAEPTNLGARLFRAEVLAALGADLQAEGELRALAGLPLPDATKQRVRQLRARIEKRKKRLSFQTNLSLGYTENDNAGNWPSDNTVLLNGEPLPTSGTNAYELTLIDGTASSAPVEDDALSQAFAVTGRYDLGSENWRSVFVSTGLNSNNGGDSGFLDGETGNFSAGLVYKHRRFTVIPRLSHAQIDNDYEQRLGNYAIHGGSLMTQYQAGSRNRITLSVGQTNLRFEGDKKSNNTDTLSGSFGWESQVGRRLVVNLGSFYQDVDARANADLDKKLSGANLSLRLAVARGQFLTIGGSSVETEHDNFYSQSFNPASETAQNGTTREDDITGSNISYLLMGNALSPTLRNVFFSLNHQNTEIDSNIVGFSQERSVLSVRVNFTYAF